jgi:hypothetical protein
VVPVPASTIGGSAKILRLVRPGAADRGFQCVQSLTLDKASRAMHWHSHCQVRAGSGQFCLRLCLRGLVFRANPLSLKFVS